MAHICMWVNSQNKWRARGGCRRGSARKISEHLAADNCGVVAPIYPSPPEQQRRANTGGTRTHTAWGVLVLWRAHPWSFHVRARTGTRSKHTNMPTDGFAMEERRCERERGGKKIRFRGFFLPDVWHIVSYHGCQNKCFLLCKSTGGDGAASADGEEGGGQKSSGDEGAKNTDVGGKEGRQTQMNGKSTVFKVLWQECIVQKNVHKKIEFQLNGSPWKQPVPSVWPGALHWIVLLDSVFPACAPDQYFRQAAGSFFNPSFYLHPLLPGRAQPQNMCRIDWLIDWNTSLLPRMSTKLVFPY